MSNVHITKHRAGFPFGYTRVLGLDETTNNVGMEFGILRLGSLGSHWNRGVDLRGSDVETQLILLNGEGVITVEDETFEVARHSLFDENPWAFDLPARCPFEISTKKGIEVAVIRAANKKTFKPVVLRPEDIPAEQRGEGVVSGTMHRIVKAIFGDPMALKRARPKASNLVVGEVINFPGRWSSYPPHHHIHDEVYYYRFDKRSGLGGCFLNEDAYVVHDHDVVKIMNCVGHAQTSAPGYAMWYLWFIRQREGNRYEGNPPLRISRSTNGCLTKTQIQKSGNQNNKRRRSIAAFFFPKSLTNFLYYAIIDTIEVEKPVWR